MFTIVCLKLDLRTKESPGSATYFQEIYDSHHFFRISVGEKNWKNLEYPSILISSVKDCIDTICTHGTFSICSSEESSSKLETRKDVPGTFGHDPRQSFHDGFPSGHTQYRQ